MRLTASRLRRALAGLGVACATRGGHCSGFVTDDDGRKLFPPVAFPSDVRDLPPAVAAHLRRQLLLSSEQFDSLVNGSMSRSDYLALRREAGGG